GELCAAAGIEIEEIAASQSGHSPLGHSKVREVSIIGRIVGRGQVGYASVDNRLDRLGDEARLEHRIVRVGEVIDNDFRACLACQSGDVLVHAYVAIDDARGESKTRARSDMVDILRHAPAFVGADRGRGPRRHVLYNLDIGRQVARGYVGGVSA